ncbi:MAG: diguanylate cyclase, partial [Deltaproteobacteria bacterium]
EVLHRVKQHNALIEVIVLTSHATIGSAVEALKNGAFDYIRKPLDEDELLHSVRSCVENKKLIEENQEIKRSLRLFEVTRQITTMLDANRLYDLIIDAFMQTVDADSGIIAFYEEGGKTLDIKAIRHMRLEDGEKLVKALKNRCDGLNGAAVVQASDEKCEPEAVAGGYGALLIAPLLKGGSNAGFVISLRRSVMDGYGRKDMESASFIAEHASAAMENAQKYAEAKGMVYIDSLTGLYNGKYLDMALEKEIKRAERMTLPVTVLFLDLDNFKLVNDQNDHLIGSKLLIEISRVFLNSVREIDTVIRYGGDEFVFILVGADDNVALKAANRIRKNVEAHEFLKEDGLTLKVTASIGVAAYPTHSKDKRELVKLADRAMYQAKDASRNTVCVAAPPQRANDPRKAAP